ncbi:hypothetical protein EU805_10680 [Salipiger sp. IMCC34102]|nr:hypothetical protein EU805_10680 [Salipiger sp. IMCC34102]
MATLATFWPDAPVAETRPFLAKRGALVVSRTPAQRPQAAMSHASLFAGQAGGSLFAPVAPRTDAAPATRRASAGGLVSPSQRIMLAGPTGGADVHRIRQIISYAESRKDGYDAVVWGARVPPPDLPTRLTIGEIFRWIDETPGQNHAIGRYQFIPSTLRRLVQQAGLSTDHIFSPAVQDQLADILLADAGLHDIRAGQIGRHRFMNNLARIWAGLPTSSGKSYYDGHAGNRSTITWAQFDAEMRQIFPDRG